MRLLLFKTGGCIFLRETTPISPVNTSARFLWVSFLFFSLMTPLNAEMKSGASTLLLGGSARSSALRGAYTAAAGDTDAMIYNPGGLSAIGRPQLSLTHAEMALGSDYDVIQYAQPQNHSAWGLTVARLGVGEIQGRDENRLSTGRQSSSDVMAQLSYSHDFYARTGVGGSIKYFESRIATEKASSVAFDFGTVTQWPNRPLWFGISILNVGSGLQYIDKKTPLPLTIGVGSALRVSGALNILLDVKRYPHDERTEVVTGLEYYLLPTTQIRLGYASSIAGTHNQSDNNLKELGNWKGGLGLGLAGYQLDYSISSDAESETLHRISLSRVF